MLLKIGRTRESYEVPISVVGIVADYIIKYQDAYIDSNCYDFIHEDYRVDRSYVSGNLDNAKHMLNQIKDIYPYIKWSNYDEVKKIGDKAIAERFIMFEVVVCILILIAGLGWVNAIRHSILSRMDEYKILRMLGMTIPRLRRMLFRHIMLYLIIGLASGIGIGMVLLMFLTYYEGGNSIIVINRGSLALVSAFLIALNLLLIPGIIKVSRSEVVMSD